jgi:hypothetical protein
MVTGFSLHCCTLVHLLLRNLYRMADVRLGWESRGSCPPAAFLSFSFSLEDPISSPTPSHFGLTPNPLEIITVLVLLLVLSRTDAREADKGVRPCRDAFTLLNAMEMSRRGAARLSRECGFARRCHL